VRSEISGKKHIMGLAGTELPNVTQNHCALWPNFEISEILNSGDLDRPQCMIQAQ
jgi:hypothetical protein